VVSLVLVSAKVVLKQTPRLAAKTAVAKVKKWSQGSWLEMGVLTMTFFGYIRRDGKIVVET
jgi:hypothetical protein